MSRPLWAKEWGQDWGRDLPPVPDTNAVRDLLWRLLWKLSTCRKLMVSTAELCVEKTRIWFSKQSQRWKNPNNRRRFHDFELTTLWNWSFRNEKEQKMYPTGARTHLKVWWAVRKSCGGQPLYYWRSRLVTVRANLGGRSRTMVWLLREYDMNILGNSHVDDNNPASEQKQFKKLAGTTLQMQQFRLETSWPKLKSVAIFWSAKSRDCRSVW